MDRAQAVYWEDCRSLLPVLTDAGGQETASFATWNLSDGDDVWCYEDWAAVEGSGHGSAFFREVSSRWEPVAILGGTGDSYDQIAAVIQAGVPAFLVLSRNVDFE